MTIKNPITIGQQLDKWLDPAYAHASCCGFLIFNSGGTDPLISACIAHDNYFVLHHKGETNLTLSEVNSIFLADCLAIANAQPTWHGRIHLRIRSYIYYGIVCTVGKRIWDSGNAKN